MPSDDKDDTHFMRVLRGEEELEFRSDSVPRQRAQFFKVASLRSDGTVSLSYMCGPDYEFAPGTAQYEETLKEFPGLEPGKTASYNHYSDGRTEYIVQECILDRIKKAQEAGLEFSSPIDGERPKHYSAAYMRADGTIERYGRSERDYEFTPGTPQHEQTLKEFPGLAPGKEACYNTYKDGRVEYVLADVRTELDK
jgi:hypothetical protein